MGEAQVGQERDESGMECCPTVLHVHLPQAVHSHAVDDRRPRRVMWADDGTVRLRGS